MKDCTMIISSQITPGMIILVDGKVCRVEFSNRVDVFRGVPFVSTTLKNVVSDEVFEKNFQIDEEIEEVKASERTLQYLYKESDKYLFLDIENLENVLVDREVIGNDVNYLKEGFVAYAFFYGKIIASLKLPRFVELMVKKTEDIEVGIGINVPSANKIATLETGAKVQCPMFVESGDTIKVDTLSGEYIQRI